CHLPGQFLDHVVFAPFEEQHGIRHVFRIGPGGDFPGARRGTAVDLVQQAGARAVREDRVLARPQPEYPLQELDALAHRGGVREWPEIAVFPVLGAAVEAQAGKFVPCDHQVGIGLVVAKQDVVARREALDQVVFEEQRLRLGASCGYLHRSDLGQHHLDAGTGDRLVEVGTNAFLQVPRLADVKRLPALAEHSVDPGEIRQAGDKGFSFEHAESIIKRVKCAPFHSGVSMAKVEAVEIRPGQLLEWDKRVWRVLKSYHVHVGGRGGAFMQVEMKDIDKGTKTNQRFRTEDKIERAFVEPREMQYLYQDGEQYVFMDKENYEQMQLDADFLEGQAGY